jgi:hypothetical protein
MKHTIKLTEAQWAKIHHDIAQNYPSSVLLIREKMKVVLGFTVRRHREWTRLEGREDREGRPIRGHWDEWIVLDFYSEKKMSWFRLKYSEQLNVR